ncbi:MAG: sigma-54-dependent Fis family transcriptional regulator [Bdellovibrionales bacterium]|nr:sigma-54-dependent Fis family transcriptional regulator [Bdellovibrionales bacterium]
MRELILLVVDDDDLVIQSVKLALPDQWRMMACQNPANLPERGYHAALVDIHLTGQLGRTEGIEVIRRLSQKHAHLEIIAMSGNLDRQIMEQCLKAGASRFLAKPLSLDELTLTLDKIEALFLMQGATSRSGTAGVRWVGSSSASQTIQRQIAQLRNENGPILIEGESGTGKEVSAALIHSQAPGGPFVAINVASVPENLFESEFFGHVKGAFTGADQNKMGLAEAANGGDLFLDEIEALSPPLQAKLLRFLETGEVRRVGAKEAMIVQCRVIAATNRNLNQLVSEGKFREDLLWRLSGKKILLPPLRERPEDIAELVRHFLSQDKYRKKEIGDDAMQVLKEYHWPGNVRELKRVCEQLILLAPLPVLRREDVLAVIRPQAQGVQTTHVDLNRGLSDLVNEYEAQIIQKALSNQNDIDEAARTLKISRSSLYKKIKDHGIQWRSE